MARKHKDWLESFINYASYGEAPVHMLFWTGVSAIAGALRRKVWIDQAYFKWHPNFYICIVAPPGIVSKSTTAGLGMELLREVDGVHFGPDVVTMQALATAFSGITEGFEYQGATHVMSAMTLESSEFGNLLDPSDKAMVDLLVSLWDGKQGEFKKDTKTSGSDSIVNPWINLIACTTPSWIAGNFPEYMIGGGFTSRTIFVYASEKRQFIAYPGRHVPKNMQKLREDLVSDLRDIAEMTGEFRLSEDAISWGEAWYKRHYSVRPINLDNERFGGYLARKQTHIHKLAMVLSAASSSNLVITAEHLITANEMVTDLEPDMHFVFSKIGRSDTSLYTERLVTFVHERGEVTYSAAYRHVHPFFPSMRDFEDVVAGCIRAGYITMVQTKGEHVLKAGTPLELATNGAGKR